MKKWYVYQHTRVDNGEIFYIGIGCINNFSRAYSKKNRSSFWERIVEKTNYKIEIIFEELSEEEAKNKEVELISKYKKIKDGGTLCNITDGGDGVSGLKHSEETKKILREKRKTQVFTDEVKKKWSLNRMGNKKALGKKHSEEKNLAKSKNQRGKFGGTIIRIDNFGNKIEFLSIKDAGDSVNTSYRNIWYACKYRKDKIYKGYYWYYKDDNKKQKKNLDDISKEYLYKRYVVDRISGYKISKEIGCSENKIYGLLKKYNFM